MLTHLSEDRQPTMVDVADKAVTERTAEARALVTFSPAAWAALHPEGTGNDLAGPKGPVFATAIVAGIQGAKRTSDLIPLCHPLPIEGIQVTCTVGPGATVEVRCRVKATHKTGVEMEALTGATVAALTLYDMTKALGPDTVIGPVELVFKRGGKAPAPPLWGLVLAGGRSTRMGTDKAALAWHGEAEVRRMAALLARRCQRVLVACRPDQARDPARAGLDLVFDLPGDEGPLAGLGAALAAHPQAAWVVAACDLPRADEAALDALVAGRDPGADATAFVGHQDLPEPLFAIWEPSAAALVTAARGQGLTCPRKTLLKGRIHLLEALEGDRLANANTPDDAARLGGLR